MRFVERYQHVVDRFTLAVALLLVGIQVYRGLTAGSVTDSTSLWNVASPALLVGGILLYVTARWRPALFLVGALLVGGAVVFWALQTPVTPRLDVGRILTGSALFGLCIYQFFAHLLLDEREQGGATRTGATE